MSPSQTLDATAAGLPESRVLIIGTGGTICMQEGPDGLAPSDGFLDSAMAPRPTFNDMSGLDGKFSSSHFYHDKTTPHTLHAQFFFNINSIHP